MPSFRWTATWHPCPTSAPSRTGTTPASMWTKPTRSACSAPDGAHATPRTCAPDALLGTLGKSAGVGGAFVAGSDNLRRLLENRARSFVFSTAPPPSIAATIQAGARLRAPRRAPARGGAATRRSAPCRAARARLGSSPPARDPSSRCSSERRRPRWRLSGELLRRGYFVHGIRPPTVPPGTSRLRIVPTAAHTDAQLDGLIAAMAALRS